MRTSLIVLTLGASSVVASAAVAQTTPPPPETPPAAAPVAGKVIFNGSFDQKARHPGTGLPRQWIGLLTNPTGRKPCFSVKCSRHAFKLVKRPVDTAPFAGRFELRDRNIPWGDYMELTGVQSPSIGKQGASRWISWSTYLPPGFNRRGANAQRDLYLMALTQDAGSPPLWFGVDRGQFVLRINEQTRTKRLAVYRPWGVPVSSLQGRWVHFDAFVNMRQSGGQVQLWVDGVQQAMNWPFGPEGNDPAAHGGVGGMVFTGRTLTPGAGPVRVRLGIARFKGLRGKAFLYHDSMMVRTATTVPVPAPPAPAPAPPAPAPPAPTG